MRHRNPSYDRTVRQTRGISSGLRAGPHGVTVRDNATEVHPATDLWFKGGTVIDLDDDVAQITLGGAGGGLPGGGGDGTSSATAIMVLNNSGGDLNIGDVVVTDETDDNAVTTTTTEGDIRIPGVVQEPIAAGFFGLVLFPGGYAAQVNAPGAERGQYAKTSTTAGEATATDDREAGSFGVFMTGADLPDFAADAVTTSSDVQVTTLDIDLPTAPVDRALFLALWLEDTTSAVDIPNWTRIGAEAGFYYFYRVATGDDAAVAAWTGLSVASAAVLLLHSSISLAVPLEDHDYDATTAAAAVAGLSDVPRYAIAGVQAAVGSPGSGFTLLAGGTGTGLAMLYNGQSGTGVVKIGLARSDDNGLTWTRAAANPVLTVGAGGTVDDVQVHAPSIVWDGSQWVMYYGGYDGANYRACRATSPDLVTWTKYGSNPVLDLGVAGAFDDAGVISPRVYFDAAATPKWKMWYAGSKSGGKVTTGFADSADGITWTKRGKVIDVGGAGTFYDEAAVFGGPILVGSTWYLFGSGQANPTNPYNHRAGYVTVALGSEGTSAAYSTPTQIAALSGNITSLSDGLTYTSNLLLTVIAQDDGTYVGYGTAFVPASAPTSNREVSFRSTSTDLVTWTTPTGELLPFAAGTFDTLSAENPTVVSVPIAGTLAGKYIGHDAAISSPFSGAGNEADAIFALNLLRDAMPAAILYGPDLSHSGTAVSEPLILEDGTIAILENGHAAMSEPVFV